MDLFPIFATKFLWSRVNLLAGCCRGNAPTRWIWQREIRLDQAVHRLKLMLRDFPKRINVGIRKQTGEITERWVRIKYDHVPKYCKNCRIQGHDEQQYYVVHPELYPSIKETMDKGKEKMRIWIRSRKHEEIRMNGSRLETNDTEEEEKIEEKRDEKKFSETPRGRGNNTFINNAMTGNTKNNSEIGKAPLNKGNETNSLKGKGDDKIVEDEESSINFNSSTHDVRNDNRLGGDTRVASPDTSWKKRIDIPDLQELSETQWCNALERLELSDEMEEVAEQSQKPWLIGGDFNVILNEEEKQGGLPFMQSEAIDFAQCINNCGLVELKYSGSNFTWWNGRIEEHCIFKRLDRVMGNQTFINLFPSSEVHHLIRRGQNKKDQGGVENME
ncbi:hypothetical protein KY289_035443 [Solanum tuberosum]|nr:hypothetical protein KY289_035443 [Solanum tuberosum]